MIKNQTLDVVYEWLLRRNLSEALAAMEWYLSTHSGEQNADRLYAIQADFQLMADYWKRGFKDPQLPHLYDNLLRRLYVFYADTARRYRINHSSYLLSAPYLLSCYGEFDGILLATLKRFVYTV